MEMRLEVVQVPVADVDAAKSFYVEKLGFVLDHDVEHIPGMRVVQLTPPGSAASIVIGRGMTSMAPGSLEGLQLVVPDIDAVRAELQERGAGISDVQDMGGVKFAFLSDPDGNRWVIQGATPPEVKSAHLDPAAPRDVRMPCDFHPGIRGQRRAPHVLRQPTGRSPPRTLPVKRMHCCRNVSRAPARCKCPPHSLRGR
jgi:catechol 2,3-dioxygenase-like lactoylglutathione lyase family enzyme